MESHLGVKPASAWSFTTTSIPCHVNYELFPPPKNLPVQSAPLKATRAESLHSPSQHTWGIIFSVELLENQACLATGKEKEFLPVSKTTGR